MVRGAYGQAGMMADADPMRPYFSRNAASAWGMGQVKRMARICFRGVTYFPLIFLSTAFCSLTGLSLREASAINRASSSSSM
jgi:hypothetical protein